MASTCWSDEETLKLIEVWGDGAIQAVLEGSRWNKDTFVRISNKQGTIKPVNNAVVKLKKLRCEYKK